MAKKKLPAHLKASRGDIHPGNPLWAEWVREIEQFLGYRICGADASKNRPYPCPKPQALGTRRCTSHGAKTPTGPGNPNYKHGRATLLARKGPRELRAAYKASLEDPGQMELRAELAMLDARLAQLWGSLNTGETVDAMGELSTLVGDLALALAEDDPDTVGSIVGKMRTVIDGHQQDTRTWSEIRKTAQLRGRLASEERKRNQVLQGFVPIQRLNMLLMFLAESIVQHVGDHPGVRGVLADVKRLNPSNGILDLDPDKELPQ